MRKVKKRHSNYFYRSFHKSLRMEINEANIVYLILIHSLLALKEGLNNEYLNFSYGLRQK